MFCKQPGIHYRLRDYLSGKIFHPSSYVVKTSEERTKRSHTSHVPLWLNSYVCSKNMLSTSVMNMTPSFATIDLRPQY
jgi:hypothetical protein